MSEHGLAFDVMVYLAAAVVCVPIAKRLGLGSILGYLAAGCAIGPWGLRFVADVESTMHFSEFGVVLMLFIIGLELEPERLKAMRREVLLGGSLQLVACAVPLALAGMLLGLPWQGALVAAVALALSSTAIVMTTLGERSLNNSTLGRSSFAILLFQDIAAIPLLVAIPLLGAGDTELGWQGPLQGIGAVIAVVVIGRYVTPHVMRRIASLHQREVFTACALLLVLGIAQIMTAVNISMGLGAFLAGVLLAGSEYRHALESDLEPFRGLLMGLFFIAVGMTVDFGLLVNEPLLVLATVVGYSVIKLGALRAIAGRVGTPTRQRWMFAVLLSQGGEFAFVVFDAARKAQLLPGDWGGVLTLTVALSMALMPLLVLVHDRLFARAPEPVADPSEHEPVESEDAPVIIAGFGRFGQIVGRILFASRLRATVLDHDADQIEFLKRFGFRVFFGDARRSDLMHAAGAAKAKVLVVAVDDADACLAIVDMARHEFPHLRIVARARNVQQWFELRRRGVELIERELFEASVSAGRSTLELLGVGRHEAFERAGTFRRHNLQLLDQLLPHLDDEARRIAVARTARDDLEQQFEREHQRLRRHAVHGWHPDDEAR